MATRPPREFPIKRILGGEEGEGVVEDEVVFFLLFLWQVLVSSCVRAVGAVFRGVAVVAIVC